MASNVQDLKGYDHQFVGTPPDDLVCLICLCVARDPQQVNCCGKVLCRGCLEEHKRHSNNCPQCRKDINSFADTRSQRHILSLKTQCDNTTNGCEWTGELRSLDGHLASCDFALFPCPNKCYTSGSGDELKVVQLLRKDVQKHTKQECPRRQYECPHCKEPGEYQERTTKHLNDCPMKEVPCPNNKCTIHIARCNLSKHRQECLFEKVPCKYVIIGCKEEVLRRDMREHEGNSQQHLQLAIDTIRLQESILAQSRGMPLKYKFTNYDHHKTANDVIFTPAFYTSPGGYKMCIRVDANGYGEANGTHVSAFAYLMKGENDNHLPWPFTGRVTIELLNQLEDKNHHFTTITYISDGVSSQRVVNEERTSNGWGLMRYVSQSDLGYNEARNSQYLKDDCLYFRFSVDAKSSLKPWLI